MGREASPLPQPWKSDIPIPATSLQCRMSSTACITEVICKQEVDTRGKKIGNVQATNNSGSPGKKLKWVVLEPDWKFTQYDLLQYVSVARPMSFLFQ